MGYIILAYIMKHLCPICQRKLTKDDKIKYVDYHCSPVKEDHHYIVRERKGVQLKVKIRLSDAVGHVYLKINFDEGYLQAWTKPGTEGEDRTRVDQIFYPDFTQIEKLREKIRTYLLFS